MYIARCEPDENLTIEDLLLNDNYEVIYEATDA